MLLQQEEIPDHTTASLVAEIKISHAVLCRVTRPLLHVQATVVYGEEQQKRFKAFLINQLTDLMEGLTNPAVIQDSEQERAFLKERNMLCMRSPRYGWQCTFDLPDLCRLGAMLCVLSIINEQGQRSVLYEAQSMCKQFACFG